MGKYVRIILFDVFMAAVIVALYSPGMLNLRPSDPSLLRAGLSVFLGIIIAASLIWVNASALREPKVKRLSGDTSIDVNEVREALSACTSDRAVGKIARSTIHELDAVEDKTHLLMEQISEKFGAGSMTYDRYAAVVTGANEAIVRNAASLAEKAQTFDGQEYHRLNMKLLNGKYKTDEIPDDVQEQKFQLFEASLTEMRNTVDANERLLLELDHLSAELTSGQDDGNQQRLDEIRELSDQLKWYRDQE